MPNERLTLLLDLDDTLLVNSMDSFLPAYLKAWGDFIAPYFEPKHFVRSLLASTDVMSQNQDPQSSLGDIFYANFYRELGIVDNTAFFDIQSRFYSDVFPTLRPLTQPSDGAFELVEEAFARDYHVAIATNPLFPLTANEQRLEWAGLPPDQYPFELVPSLTTFHFAKPNPALYAEFLAHLGWPDGPVIMIGNDPELDIAGAIEFGLPAYWVCPDGAHFPQGSSSPSGQGTLRNFFSWLDGFGEETLIPNLEKPEASLSTLRATPAVFHTLTRWLPNDAWLGSPRPGEWSATEITCHLRDVEQEVNLPRLQKVITEDNPFLPGIDTDCWAEERHYIRQDGNLALREYAKARLQSLELLSSIPATDWERQARHAIFGRTNLTELVSIMAGHDRLHVRQMKMAIPASLQQVQRIEFPKHML